MPSLFSPQSTYTQRARFIAILWTLLILFACLTPSKEIPKVDVPFIDKWTHLVLFGGLTFLWLCGRPIMSRKWLLQLWLLATVYGAIIEVLQGTITVLGRSMELLDGIADSLGGILGIGLFYLFSRIFVSK